MDSGTEKIGPRPIADELTDLLRDYLPGAFVTKVHEGFRDGSFGLRDAETLIQKIFDARIALEEWDYPYESSMWPDTVYCLGIQYVFIELEKMLRERQADLREGVVVRGEQRFDAYALRTYLNDAADRELEKLRQAPETFWRRECMADGEVEEDLEDFSAFFNEILRRLSRYDEADNDPLYRLLDHLRPERAVAMLDLLRYYFRPETPRKFRDEELECECGSRDALSEQIARRINTAYCYFFLESANNAEIRNYNAAHARREKAEAFPEFLIALTEELFWLEIPALLPVSVYRALTDEPVPIPAELRGVFPE